MTFSECAPSFAPTALGLWTNEGAAGAPAQPGKRHEARGQREALAPSCSPNRGEVDSSGRPDCRCALRARKDRWSPEA
jgi:hypothetical protein